MDLGRYHQGDVVWLPALSHAGTGAEINPTTCTGKYYKVGTLVSTPLTFNQFDSETGVWYAVIDTSGLPVGAYIALVEELIAGVNKNAMHVFQVEAAGAAAITLQAVTVGDCLSAAEVSALIDTSDYTATQIQMALDWSFGFLSYLLGHTFGRAFRIYHDESAGATACTVTVDTTKVRIVITGGANAGNHDFTYAAFSQIGQLVQAINDDAMGAVATLFDVIPYDQPSANLKAMAATNIFGFANRRSIQFAQWQECMDGDNEHYKQVRMPIRAVISVIEDGVTLAANTDYHVHTYQVEKVCCAGGCGNCWTPGYWSCRSTCNVCITYIPTWFGMCPQTFIDALLGFVQLRLESKASGHYKSEQIGDYRYSKGNLTDDYAFYYQNVMQYHIAAKWPI